MANERYRRRSFLKQALAISVLPPTASSFKPVRQDGGIKLAVRGPFPEKNLQSRAALLSKLGYQGIELGPEYLAHSANYILEQIQGHGISVSAIVGSIQLLDSDPSVRDEAVELDRRRLYLARQLGAMGVIEVPTFGPCRFGSDDVEDNLLVEGLKKLIPDVKRTGVSILLEPLTRRETHYMNLQEHGARIIRAVGSKGFSLLSDFYHMQMEEANISETIQQFGHLMAYVHMADGEARTEPGSLPFDYRPCFGQLKAHGYTGWLTVESGATDDPESALARAREYILQQWNEA